MSLAHRRCTGDVCKLSGNTTESKAKTLTGSRWGGGEAVKRFPLLISLHFQPFYYEVAFKKKKKQEKSKTTGSQEWIISCL